VVAIVLAVAVVAGAAAATAAAAVATAVIASIAEVAYERRCNGGIAGYASQRSTCRVVPVLTAAEHTAAPVKGSIGGVASRFQAALVPAGIPLHGLVSAKTVAAEVVASVAAVVAAATAAAADHSNISGSVAGLALGAAVAHKILLLRFWRHIGDAKGADIEPKSQQQCPEKTWRISCHGGCKEASCCA